MFLSGGFRRIIDGGNIMRIRRSREGLMFGVKDYTLLWLDLDVKKEFDVHRLNHLLQVC